MRLTRLSLGLLLGVSALLNVAVVIWLGSWVHAPFFGYVNNDFYGEVLPVYRALAHGQLLQAFQASPSYLGAALARAPLAVPALWLGAGRITVYEVSAIPCVCAGPALAAWLISRRPDRRVSPSDLPLALLMLNPVSAACLDFGHPEEIVTAAVAIAAVVAVTGPHKGQAGWLLALAVILKPWAIVAVPVVLAVGGANRRTLVSFLVPTVAFWVPDVAVHYLQAGAGSAAGSVTAASGTIFDAPQLLYWFSDGSWVVQHAHLLIVLAPVPVVGLWSLTRGREAGIDLRSEGLWLLALVLFIRFACDPWDVVYYPLPFVMCLMAMGNGRAAALALFASVISFVVNSPYVLLSSSGAECARTFASVALPALLVLGLRCSLPSAWASRLASGRLGALRDLRLVGRA